MSRQEQDSGGLTHLDSRGHARMVDVGEKPVSRRVAVAEARVSLSREAFARIQSGQVAKGDVFAICRVAGIQAAKRTPEWIPLAHPLALEQVAVELESDEPHAEVRILARVATSGRTGVEMEAMVAVSAAALTLYDMCKAIDRGIVIGPVRLLEKAGGRSGRWVAEAADKSPSLSGSDS